VTVKIDKHTRIPRRLVRSTPGSAKMIPQKRFQGIFSSGVRIAVRLRQD
jgi:hypothetical protein